MAIENGRYHVVYRWVPQAIGDSATLRLGRLGLKIMDQSKLLDILSTRTGESKKALEKLYSGE